MALENVLSQEMIQRLGWTLLHFVWQATAMAFLLTILLAALRTATASVRYIIACAALGLIVLLPIMTMSLVPISSPHPSAKIESPPTPLTMSTQPMAIEAPVARIVEVEEPAQAQSIDVAPKVSWKQRVTEKLEASLSYIVMGWLIGVFALSLWHLGGWVQLQRLKRHMVKPVDASLLATLNELAARLRVHRLVRLVESALVQVPTVVGWLRPVILVPASALTGLSTEQLEALLGHELAHIRRGDYLVNILQTIVETLGFYHPGVWWVSHKIRVERENCCDDLAVSLAGDRVRYARALASMEEIRSRRNELAVAATGGNLFGRIHRLIGKDATDSYQAGWIPSVVTILLIAIIAIPTALALTSHDKTEHSAQFLLEKMLEHRSRIRNLQYVAENNLGGNAAAERDGTEEFIKRMEDRIQKRREEGASERDIGFSERALERIKVRKSLTEASARRYETLQCTTDNEGRSKIELTRGAYDASGEKMSYDYKHIRAWNNVQSTHFYQGSESLPRATIKEGASSFDHPWWLFTGALCQFLEETLKDEREVSVEKLKDGTYRVAFDYKTRKIVAVIDPSKGYTCALHESYDNGQLNSRHTATYKEIAKGIWFPVSGQLETHSGDSPNYKRSFTSSQIRINDPAFNASYFDVDMPEGTTVTDEVRGNQYVAGSKRVHDLNEPQKLSADMEEVDPNAWQEAFFSIYRLEAGQVLKRIAPPFIPERRDYFLSIRQGRYSPNMPEHVVRLYFNWDGNLSIRSSSAGGGIPRLNSILGSVIGLSNSEYNIPPEILYTDMSGDWIVRKDTPQEELLQALEQIIKEETGKEIHFVKREEADSEVIVARGTYRLTPLANAKQKDCVHVYTDELDTYSGAGGGSGTLNRFLRFIGDRRINRNIIDKTDSSDVRLSWRNHYSSDFSWLAPYQQQHNEKVDMLLDNLARQTGLIFERETTTVEKWFVEENGTVRIPQNADAGSLQADSNTLPRQSPEKTNTPVVSGGSSEGQQGLPPIPQAPLPEKTATPSDEDKSIVKLDLSVVEVFSDSKMDRETITAIENLLGGKITLPNSPAVADLIRKTAEAAAAVKDESAGDKRVTQDQFKTLVDLLISRGYVKILMNPTLQVVNGKTAKISSSQHIRGIQDALEDSIQITPNVLESGNIFLIAKAIFHQLSFGQSNEQTPIVNTFEGAIHLHLRPGESGIMSLKVQTAEKDLEAPDTEVLLILTPTILKTVKQSNKKLREEITPNRVVLKLVDPNSQPVAGARVGTYVDWSDIAENPPIWFLRDGRSYRTVDVESDKQGKVTLEAEDLFRPEWAIERKAPLTAIDAGHYLAGLRELSRKDLGTEVTLTLQPGCRVRGRVSAATARQHKWSTKTLTVYVDWRELRLCQYTSKQGRFEMVLPPGTYQLKVYAEDPDNAVTLPIQIRPGQRELDLTKYLEGQRKLPGIISIGQDGEDRFSVGLYEDPRPSNNGSRVYVVKSNPAFSSVIQPQVQVVCLVVEVSPPLKRGKEIDNMPGDTSIPLDTKIRPFISSADLLLQQGIETTEVVGRRKTQEPSKAILDVLRSRGHVRVLMNPTLQLIEGQTVKIEAGAEDFLQVTPHMIEGGYINMQFKTTFQTEIIRNRGRQPPIINKHTLDIQANTKSGESLIIGATKKIEQAEGTETNETNTEKEATDLVFILSPTITETAGEPQDETDVKEWDVFQVITPRIIKLQNSDPAQMARMLTTLFAKEDGDGVNICDVILGKDAKEKYNMVGPLSDHFKFEEVPGTNRIIVISNIPRAYDAVVNFIVELDQQKMTTQNVKQIREWMATRVRKAQLRTPKTINEVEQSSHRMKLLGLAMAMYANEHEDTLPDTLLDVKPYVRDEQDFNWMLEHVEYFGEGKTTQQNVARTHIAYDRTMLEGGIQTNVLFLDFSVRLLVRKQLDELAPGGVPILIQTRVLMVGDAFMKYIGLDPNSVASSEGWSDYLVQASGDSANFVIDQLHADLLVKAAAAHKDSKALMELRVCALDGMKVTSQVPEPSRHGVTIPADEPNRPSGEPESKTEREEYGSTLRLTPNLTPDGKTVYLGFDWERRRFLGFKKQVDPDKQSQKVPQVAVDRIRALCPVPEGKTLLIAGKKLTERIEVLHRVPLLGDAPLVGWLFSSPTTVEQTRHLLILAKPVVGPEKKVQATRVPEPSPLDSDDPLIRKLEEKLEHSDE